MTPYYYFAKKTDNGKDEGMKKIVFYALCYIAIGLVVNLVLLVSESGILTSSCPAGTCPTMMELMRNLILNQEFWLNVIIWPVKLIAFLWRSI